MFVIVSAVLNNVQTMLQTVYSLCCCNKGTCIVVCSLHVYSFVSFKAEVLETFFSHALFGVSYFCLLFTTSVARNYFDLGGVRGQKILNFDFINRTRYIKKMSFFETFLLRTTNRLCS